MISLKNWLAQIDFTFPQRPDGRDCGRSTRTQRLSATRRTYACNPSLVPRRSARRCNGKSRFIWLRSRVRSPGFPPLSLPIPNVRMNSESDFPRTSSRFWVRTASVHTQASNRRGRLPKGSLLSRCRHSSPRCKGSVLRRTCTDTAGRGWCGAGSTAPSVRVP